MYMMLFNSKPYSEVREHHRLDLTRRLVSLGNLVLAYEF
jgi:hypothetical protein